LDRTWPAKLEASDADANAATAATVIALPLTTDLRHRDFKAVETLQDLPRAGDVLFERRGLVVPVGRVVIQEGHTAALSVER
jgi:hypothetical protein